MKRPLRVLVLLATAACATVRAQSPAADPNPPFQPVLLEQKQPAYRNRVSVSYRMGLNITADFKNLGGFTAQSDPGSVSGLEDRTYDNGYNRVDSSTNAMGYTWFWGYSSGGSVQGNTLVFDSSSSPSTAVSEGNQDDPQHGFEIAYSRELYRHPKKGWRAGVEGAVGYTHIAVTDSRTLRATANRVTDVFIVPDGTVLPSPGYAGTFEGPGPVIGSEPAGRTVTNLASAATIVGERSIDADVVGFRLGPYFELPLDEKFSVLLSGGLYLAVGHTDFHFRETVDIEGVGTQERRGSGTQTDFLVGGYVGGNVCYALTPEFGLFAGAQFQSAGEAVNKEAGKKAILNLGESVVVSIGASYSF